MVSKAQQIPAKSTTTRVSVMEDGRSVAWTCFNGPEELAAAFQDWGMEVTQLGPETGEHWVASSSLGKLQFRATHLTGRYRIRTALPERMVLIHVDRGPTGMRCFGGAHLGRDDILLGIGRIELHGVLGEHHHGISFIIPESLVLEALEARAPQALELMHRPSPCVISDCGQELRVLRRFVEAALMPRGLPQEHFLAADVLDSLTNLLVSAGEADSAPGFRRPRVQCLPLIHRVEAFMRARLDEPLTLHDICHAAHASQRTVEYAFSSVYGMGPKQYFKTLRLNEVRRALKSAPPDEASIKSIAYRFGFWHLGHFFTDYRRLFGETPAQVRMSR